MHMSCGRVAGRRSEKVLCRGKRDLLQRQKRPTTEAKETYYSGKRDLHYYREETHRGMMRMSCVI